MNFRSIINPFPNEELLNSSCKFLVLTLLRESLDKNLGDLKIGSSKYNISKLSEKTGFTRKTVKKTLEELILKKIINIKEGRINILNYNTYIYSDNVEQRSNVISIEGKKEVINTEVENENITKEIQDVINKFNEKASKEFSRVEYQTNSIILAIEDRLKEDSFDMDKILEKINNSDFLRGKGSGGWTADFEWIIKKDNYSKILNGKYNNKNKIEKKPIDRFEHEKDLRHIYDKY